MRAEHPPEPLARREVERQDVTVHTRPEEDMGTVSHAMVPTQAR